MIDVLDKLRGGLVASCQPVDEGPMDRPDIVAAMAQAAVLGGAAGLRIEGVENLRAVRPFVSVPIIGIVKSDWLMGLVLSTKNYWFGLAPTNKVPG